jgi:hypothetical protein
MVKRSISKIDSLQSLQVVWQTEREDQVIIMFSSFEELFRLKNFILHLQMNKFGRASVDSLKRMLLALSRLENIELDIEEDFCQNLN